MKLYYFHNFLKVTNLQKIISSSLFPYFERTIASTETNDTSAESSDIQLFGAGKFKGVALSGGPHTYLLQNVYFVHFLQVRGGFLTFCLL